LLAATRRDDLAIIVAGGEVEAAVRIGDAGTDAATLERERLEHDLVEVEGWLAAARARLANDAFTSRAPADVVSGARAREAELAEQVTRLRDRLGQ
jgi:valyl-tRNA synthetase